jgi:hypothetical protein
VPAARASRDAREVPFSAKNLMVAMGDMFEDLVKNLIRQIVKRNFVDEDVK